MERFHQIVNHSLYKQHTEAINSSESHRIYCGHDTQHFLDVSRIGYIYVLEHGLQVNKEVIYAYGFLHDIGRAEAYSTGEDHDKVSARIAVDILNDTDFTEGEKAQIIGAIEQHRDMSLANAISFEGLMYRADKASRACYKCKAISQCHWEAHKKNKTIEV